MWKDAEDRTETVAVEGKEKQVKATTFPPFKRRKIIWKLPINYIFYFYLLGIHDLIMAVANL